MAFLNQTFRVNDLPKGTGGNFDPLPAGWYTANIVAVEIKPTKAGTGEYLSFRYDITGPTHEGRVVFGTINVRNASPKAEEIGQQQLGELMSAVGLSEVSDTDQFIGAPVQIKLAIEKSEQYGDKNNIKGFKSAGASAPSFAPRASAPAAQSAPAASTGRAAPPWAKK